MSLGSLVLLIELQ